MGRDPYGPIWARAHMGRARARPWQGHGQYKLLARLWIRAFGAKPPQKMGPGKTGMSRIGTMHKILFSYSINYFLDYFWLQQPITALINLRIFFVTAINYSILYIFLKMQAFSGQRASRRGFFRPENSTFRPMGLPQGLFPARK